MQVIFCPVTIWRKDYKFKRDATEPYSPQYRETKNYCRSKIRELGYLDYDEKRPVENLNEVVLNKDKLSFENAARDINKCVARRN